MTPTPDTEIESVNDPVNDTDTDTDTEIESITPQIQGLTFKYPETQVLSDAITVFVRENDKTPFSSISLKNETTGELDIQVDKDFEEEFLKTTSEALYEKSLGDYIEAIISLMIAEAEAEAEAEAYPGDGYDTSAYSQAPQEDTGEID